MARDFYYPKVMTEDETLHAVHAGKSLARFGDGEIKIACGGQAVSQKPDEKLRKELLSLLQKPSDALVAIPRLRNDMPFWWFWEKYTDRKYTNLYKLPKYGSTFVSRPDTANQIDRPDYWDAVRALWAGKDIIYISGDESAISEHELLLARSIRRIDAPKRDAYDKIGEIEESIGFHAGPVIMCLGACATALAGRLAKKSVHGIDLGHIGMFMKHQGAYSMKVTDLTSESYRSQLEVMHSGAKWGTAGRHHAEVVRDFCNELRVKTIVDYGCGRATLSDALKPHGIKVHNYDPGIKEYQDLPKPAGLVVATDVLEHIEPDKVDAVLDHIKALASKGAFLIISTGQAKETLPDGRNAHISCHPEKWWLDKIEQKGWTVLRHETRKGLFLWLKK